jgi:serine/threonine-protein kinase
VSSGEPHKSPALPPGARIGEYEVVRVIGQGGMGTVYLGVHPLIRKQVAIKVMAAALSQDPDMTQRFIQEARTANDVGHPNIVEVFTFGQLPTGEAYLVMDYLVGESLEARLGRELELPIDEVARIFDVVCDALGAAHRRGIVHRDLKPDNIFLVSRPGQPSEVKLLDFGIAKLLDPQMSLTRTTGNVVFGTPVVMSPEQAINGDVDVRSDVYSIGIILFRALTGRYPFEAKSALHLLQMHLSEPPPRPATLAPVPRALDAVVVRCLAKKPVDRPSLAEVQAALRAAAVDPTPVRPRGAMPIYLATIALTALVGLGGVVWMKKRHPPAAPAPAPVTVARPAPAPPPAAMTPSPTTPASAGDVPPPARMHKPPGRNKRAGEVPVEPSAKPAAPPPAPKSTDEDATIDWKPAAKP